MYNLINVTSDILLTLYNKRYFYKIFIHEDLIIKFMINFSLNT